MAALAVAVVGASVLAAAPAGAYPGQCWPVAARVDTPFGGYCDTPPAPGGQHWHCEWGGFIVYGGTCSWRWGDNTLAPPP